MRRFGKMFLKFILSVIIATLVASLFSTQFVIAALENSGAQVRWSDRLDMNLYDLSHFGPVYGIFIFFGLAIAFPVAARIHHFTKTKRPLIYMIAGMVCFAVMLYLMQTVVVGVSIIAGARTSMGFAFQALAGGLGGYVFAKLTSVKADKNIT